MCTHGTAVGWSTELRLGIGRNWQDAPRIITLFQMESALPHWLGPIPADSRTSLSLLSIEGMESVPKQIFIAHMHGLCCILNSYAMFNWHRKSHILCIIMYLMKNYKSLQVAVDQVRLRPMRGPLVPNSLCEHAMLYISLYDFNVHLHFLAACVLLESRIVQDACEMQRPTSHWY